MEQLTANLDLAEELLAIDGSAHSTDIRAGITLAEPVSRWQALSLGTEWVEAFPLVGYTRPSDAITDLSARHNVGLGRHHLELLSELDQIDTSLGGALARVLDAFLAFDAAARGAYAGADLQLLHHLSEKAQTEIDDPRFHQLQGLNQMQHGWAQRDSVIRLQERGAKDETSASRRMVGDLLAQHGVDLAPVLSTRGQLLDAIAAFEEVVRIAPDSMMHTMSGHGHIDLCPVAAFDLEGVDSTYTNDCALIIDAGGNDRYYNNAGGTNFASGTCAPLSALYAPAALIDLGTGDDEYGNPLDPRDCGANGGGFWNAGFLFDAGGNDTYTAGERGTNGGGVGGAGFILDTGGKDSYVASQGGTNGGGVVGLGALIDTDGDDLYSATDFGSNGGGYLGIGSLIDTNGSDIYTAGDVGTNGGANVYSAGFLFDTEGNDTYTAGNAGTNGGGNTYAAGFLLDAAGNDTYTAGHSGTNGGGRGGVGFLLDAAGNDTYTAGHNGTNGGGSLGVGFLFDAAGNDTYTARYLGTNGGGSLGVGFLFDAAGDDRYIAETMGANGGADLGVGFLFDAEGTDYYQDPSVPGYSCWDCTVMIKGLVGTQWDYD